MGLKGAVQDWTRPCSVLDPEFGTMLKIAGTIAAESLARNLAALVLIFSCHKLCTRCGYVSTSIAGRTDLLDFAVVRGLLFEGVDPQIRHLWTQKKF